MYDQLRQQLFPGDGATAYAIIDGASCGGLLTQLDALQPAYICLYPGEPAPDVEEVAPYLVELLPDHAFTDWLLAGCWGNHWGIFVRSAANIRVLRKHFRSLLFVKSPEAKLLYFRFYDPRVLTIFLPTTSALEWDTIFGPISAFISETGSRELTVYRRRGTKLDWHLVRGLQVDRKT